MKGLDKLTPIRLAEALSQKGAIDSDSISEALYAHQNTGESFVELLIETGSISEWDLAKIVVEHFQLPFVLPTSYESPKEASELMPKELQFETQVVPVDVFGDILTVAIPVYTSAEVFTKIEKATEKKLFPCVGLVSANRKALSERFEDFLEWSKQREQQRKDKKAEAGPSPQGGVIEDWESIFDVGDESVRNSLD